MTEQGASAILVRAGERLMIVTDADLRAQVVAGEVSREDPVVRDCRRGGARRPDRLAVDAVVDMLESGVDHLVVEDHCGAVLGIVSATDVMGFETWSPFALRHAALRAHDEDELVASPEACAACSRAARGRPAAVDIGRVLTLQIDSLRLRLIDFAIARTDRRRPRGPGSCSAAPRGASSRSAQTRRTRSPTRTATPIRRSTPTSSASRRTSTRARALRLPARRQRRAGAQPRVADERVGVDQGLRATA